LRRRYCVIFVSAENRTPLFVYLSCSIKRFKYYFQDRTGFPYQTSTECKIKLKNNPNAKKRPKNIGRLILRVSLVIRENSKILLNLKKQLAFFFETSCAFLQSISQPNHFLLLKGSDGTSIFREGLTAS